MGLYSSPAPPSSMSMDAKSELKGRRGGEGGHSEVVKRGEACTATTTGTAIEDRVFAADTCIERLVTLCPSRCSCLCTA